MTMHGEITEKVHGQRGRCSRGVCLQILERLSPRNLCHWDEARRKLVQTAGVTSLRSDGPVQAKNEEKLLLRTLPASPRLSCMSNLL